MLWYFILHLFSFKTPTLWALMSEGNVAIWAFSTQNGVKRISEKYNRYFIIGGCQTEHKFKGGILREP